MYDMMKNNVNWNFFNDLQRYGLINNYCLHLYYVPESCWDLLLSIQVYTINITADVNKIYHFECHFHSFQISGDGTEEMDEMMQSW